VSEAVPSKGTILIVDDEPDVVHFIAKVCEPQGYKVITATDGVDALACLTDELQAVDLVILDLNLPGMHGMDILESIRARDKTLPVIVLSARHDLKSECEAFGIAAFFAKPYNEMEDLFMHIHVAIEKAKRAPQQEASTIVGIPRAKILLVDDEEEVCEILTESLKEDVPDMELDARYAIDARMAMKVSNEFEPDVAIVDIKMPHMWGDELIDCFKRGDAYCPKDFIIYTAADIPEKRKKAAEQGYQYLTKPVKFDNLVGILREICLRHNLVK